MAASFQYNPEGDHEELIHLSRTSLWLYKATIGALGTVSLTLFAAVFGIIPQLATQDWVNRHVIERPPILDRAPGLLENVADIQTKVGALETKVTKQYTEIDRRLLRIEFALGVDKSGRPNSKQ